MRQRLIEIPPGPPSFRIVVWGWVRGAAVVVGVGVGRGVRWGWRWGVWHRRGLRRLAVMVAVVGGIAGVIWWSATRPPAPPPWHEARADEYLLKCGSTGSTGAESQSWVRKHEALEDGSIRFWREGEVTVYFFQHVAGKPLTCWCADRCVRAYQVLQ